MNAEASGALVALVVCVAAWVWARWPQGTPRRTPRRLTRGYRGRDVGPHGKPPTTPATAAGATAHAALLASAAAWDALPVLGRDGRGEYRSLYALADAASTLRMGDKALTLTAAGFNALPWHTHDVWVRWRTPSFCVECGLGSGASGPVDGETLLVVEPDRLVRLVGQDN